MTTQLLIKKLDRKVEILKEDLQEIKKFLYAPPKDFEGEYRESFIKKVLARAQSRGPFYRFSDKESFLKHVRSKK